VRAGQTVNLLAKFVGPTGYKWDAYFSRWRLNGTNISSAPGTPLVLTNIQHSQAGFYIAEGFQGCGPILSPPVLVTVLPEFVSTEWLAPAQVRLTYDKSPNRAVDLEFTSALGTSNWVSLGIISNAQVRATFLDGMATNLQRFYRLRLVP